MKEEGAKKFLGGSDMRDKVEAIKLKSIDDFNKSEEAGGSDAAPVLDRLQKVLEEFGIERELYDQVVDGMKNEFSGQITDQADLLEAVQGELGKKLKVAMKSIAAEQLRIK